jgi:hypothetical protein
MNFHVASLILLNANRRYLRFETAPRHWDDKRRIRILREFITLLFDLTLTSTVIPKKASLAPGKLPATGIAWRISRATATGIRLKPPMLRFVGSKVIQPAPGT